SLHDALPICPSLVSDGHVFCYFGMFFLLGSLVEETPCEHGENMQTPHRKAWEIAHLSTVHSGEELPPRAHSAPCGNRTHALLAVRQQCKQLSHRATSVTSVTGQGRLLGFHKVAFLHLYVG